MAQLIIVVGILTSVMASAEEISEIHCSGRTQSTSWPAMDVNFDIQLNRPGVPENSAYITTTVFLDGRAVNASSAVTAKTVSGNSYQFDNPQNLSTIDLELVGGHRAVGSYSERGNNSGTLALDCSTQK